MNSNEMNPNEENQSVLEYGQMLRRSILKRAMALTVGAGAFAAVSRPAEAAANGFPHVTAFFNTAPAAGSPNATQVPGSGDFKVLNYALALEDLEASLYVQALARLTGGGTSDTGTAFGGLNVSGDDVDYFREFGQVEADHAAFLRTAIQNAGGTPIPKFLYDFNLESLDRTGVVSLVYTAELTGVTAYTGAIPFFSSISSPYLLPASAILGTEARHTAVLASILQSSTFGLTNLQNAPTYQENNGRDLPLTPDQVLNSGGTTNPSVTIAGNGVVNPVTGPNGFVYLPNTH